MGNVCRKLLDALFAGFGGIFAAHGYEDLFFVLFDRGEFATFEHFKTVDLVLDIVAELKSRHQAFVDEDGFASTGIPCGASLAGLAGESAETANFDCVPIYQFFADEFEELFDNRFDVTTHKSGRFGNFLNKTLFSNVWHDIKYRFANEKSDGAMQN